MTTILIVATTRTCSTLDEVLRAGSYQTRLAERWTDAVGVLMREPIDLLIIDPGAAGVDLRSLARFLSSRRDSDPPVLLLEDAPREGGPSPAMRIGAQGTLRADGPVRSTLEAIEQALRPARPAEAPRPGTNPRGQRTGVGRRVVLLETDPDYRVIARMALTSAAFHVIEISSPIELRVLVRAGGFDILVLDPESLRLGESETRRQLQAIPPQIPVVLWTDLDPGRLAWLEPGRHLPVPKRMGREVLVDSIRELFLLPRTSADASTETERESIPPDVS